MGLTQFSVIQIIHRNVGLKRFFHSPKCSLIINSSFLTFILPWFLLLSQFIFPDFPGENESFSLTNLFTRNTNIGFQSLAIALETKAAERI